MEEIIVNLHIHTHYSDGSGSHKGIAKAAIQCGLDAVIVTDHNVLVMGFEGYFSNGVHQVLMLIGEEVHDQDHAAGLEARLFQGCRAAARFRRRRDRQLAVAVPSAERAGVRGRETGPAPRRPDIPA